jgi:hypothetical protein
MSKSHDFFGDDWRERITELFIEAKAKLALRVEEARQQRPELGGKTDEEIARILQTEDFLERKRRFERS